MPQEALIRGLRTRNGALRKAEADLSDLFAFRVSAGGYSRRGSIAEGAYAGYKEALRKVCGRFSRNADGQSAALRRVGSIYKTLS